MNCSMENRPEVLYKQAKVALDSWWYRMNGQNVSKLSLSSQCGSASRFLHPALATGVLALTSSACLCVTILTAEWTDIQT